MATEKLGVLVRRSKASGTFERRFNLDILIVVAYKPHRTNKGHYVWRKSGVVRTGYRYGSWWNEYKHLPEVSYHNKPMTPDEVIQMMAEEGLEK